MTHQEALNIAAQAWDQVKPEDDPPFEKCAPDHKFRLAYKVESVAKTGTLEDDFDRDVYAILNPPQGVSPVTPIPDAQPAPTIDALLTSLQDEDKDVVVSIQPNGEASIDPPAVDQPKRRRRSRAKAAE